jgi:RHS repeat-associated protein
MRYKPWGEVRYSWTASTSTTPSYSLADYTFTGQYSYMDDPSTSGVTEGFDLMFYNARWYDPSLGRFAQADSIVPAGVQGYDRYAYVNNNPVKYTDPTGHCPPVGDNWCYEDEEGQNSGGLLGGIATTLSIVSDSLEYLKNNPITISNNLTFEIPVVMAQEYSETPAIIKHLIDIKILTRIGGRGMGDVLLPALLPVSILITIAPNQIENILTGSTSWNDYVGDFVVDGGGFILSEATGTAAGAALIETGGGALVGKVTADFAFGLAWEAKMESGGRQSVINGVGNIPSLVVDVVKAAIIVTKIEPLQPYPQIMPVPTPPILGP